VGCREWASPGAPLRSSAARPRRRPAPPGAASTISLGGVDYLILALEYIPRQSALDWADGILKANADKPVILVTHDLDDVIRLADRMCVLNGGEILQTGTVEQVMAHPDNPLVAELLDLSGDDEA
jgi:hypothetical protein